jgi:hypothetical protein
MTRMGRIFMDILVRKVGKFIKLENGDLSGVEGGGM